MHSSKAFKKLAWAGLILTVSIGSSGCASLRSVFAMGDKNPQKNKPIADPFGYFHEDVKAAQNGLIIRSRSGERAVEFEIPHAGGQITDLTVPISKEMGSGRGIASVGDEIVDAEYREQRPTLADREIISEFPKTSTEDNWKQQEIEAGLGLVAPEDETPKHDTSYLASIDHVKQLFRLRRYEAALIEVDKMIRMYPTDARLYEMRGTLLDRLGHTNLAIQSWNQALKFNPENKSLERFINRRQTRSVASP